MTDGQIKSVLDAAAMVRENATHRPSTVIALVAGVLPHTKRGALRSRAIDLLDNAMAQITRNPDDAP